MLCVERTEERGNGFCGCGSVAVACGACQRAHFGEEPLWQAEPREAEPFFLRMLLGVRVFARITKYRMTARRERK